MREVRLYGHLGKKFGSLFKLNVASPAEAFRALRANFPDFEAYMHQHAKQGFRVRVGKSDINGEQLEMESANQTISITPVVAGAGRGTMQMILGAVIIAAAFVATGGTIAGVLASTVAKMAVQVGVAMVLGGIAQALTSPPSTATKSADNKASYTFNGPVNTVQQGNPVPICYGQMLVGSQVVFQGLTVEQTFTQPSAGAGTKRAYKNTPWDSVVEQPA